MEAKRDPFECWYSLADVADRLGVSVRTVRRAFFEDADLQAAAREFFGEIRMPWSAWSVWLSKRHPAVGMNPRIVAMRDAAGRFLRNPVIGRTEAEARRNLKSEVDNG